MAERAKGLRLEPKLGHHLRHVVSMADSEDLHRNFRIHPLSAPDGRKATTCRFKAIGQLSSREAVAKPPPGDSSPQGQPSNRAVTWQQQQSSEQ
mmetsp:Transcript_35256/g.79951  ORF Transcript_35256/g.79951 Transcript_35256/m.79951 type:complete len:94 (-) Transcript_35256:893-1174(-)